MNQLTAEQIKTLEDAFASYPENYKGHLKYSTMKGIQEQLDELNGHPGFICYISDVNIEYDDNVKFAIKKLQVGEQQ